MRKISKESMGIFSTPFILSLLQLKDCYGYEIMQKAKELSSGRIIWKEGSLYPVLKRMESLKYISSYWDLKTSDRPRKYYKILKKGTIELEFLKEDWKLLYNIIKDQKD